MISKKKKSAQTHRNIEKFDSDARFKTLFPISNKRTIYIKRFKKTIRDKDEIEEMAKGQKGLKIPFWPFAISSYQK